MRDETAAGLNPHRITDTLAEQFPAEWRLRREDEDRNSFNVQFESASARSDEIPSAATRVFHRDGRAERHEPAGTNRGNCERFVERDVGRDFDGESRLTFREICGFLAMHIVLVLRSALLADGFLARQEGGAGL